MASLNGTFCTVYVFGAEPITLAVVHLDAFMIDFEARSSFYELVGGFMQSQMVKLIT